MKKIINPFITENNQELTNRIIDLMDFDTQGFDLWHMRNNVMLQVLEEMNSKEIKSDLDGTFTHSAKSKKISI